MRAKWKQPATMNDGSPFTAAQFAGWELIIDGKPAIAVPLTWNGNPDTEYSFDLSELQLTEAAHKLTMRTLEKDGDVSAMSPEVTFIYKRAPLPPLMSGVA